MTDRPNLTKKKEKSVLDVLETCGGRNSSWELCEFLFSAH